MRKKSKSKKISNIVVRPVIEDKLGKYRLYLVTFENKLHPILDVNHFTEFGESEYLLKTLYPTLTEYLDNKKVTDEFVDILDEIPITDFSIIREMIEEGIKLNFFKYVK